MTYRIQRADTPLAVLPLDEQCFPSDHRPSLENSLWWVVWRGRGSLFALLRQTPRDPERQPQPVPGQRLGRA